MTARDEAGPSRGEAHTCVPFAPTADGPNLLVWTGDRHVLALELKADDASPETAAREARRALFHWTADERGSVSC